MIIVTRSNIRGGRRLINIAGHGGRDNAKCKWPIRSHSSPCISFKPVPDNIGYTYDT